MCSAMSCGSVYSFPAYLILVGDVRVLLLDGSIESRTLVCALGLFLFSSNPGKYVLSFCSFDIFVELNSIFSVCNYIFWGGVICAYLI